MRLLSVVTKSSSYLQDFYVRYRQLAGLSFKEQYEALVNDTYGGAEIWSAGLLPLDYQTVRCFANISILQKRWAQENNFIFDEVNWVESIAREQIKEFQPEILIVSNYSVFSAEFVKKLRNDVSSIRLIVGWCGSPHRYQPIFQEFDFILSPSPDIVHDFVSKGYCCYHLNLAFDPRVLEKLDNSKPPSVDFSFVGSIIMAPGFHNEREKILAQLANATKIEIWSPLEHPTVIERIVRKTSQFSYDIFQFIMRNTIRIDSPMIPRWLKILVEKERPSPYVDYRITRRAHPPVMGIPMFQKLRDCKVTLNTHIDITPKSAANMRLFEATGVGTCLLTDWKENLKDLFESDIEVATYQDATECIAKVRYLLQNEEERKKIAEAGQKRVLQNHTIYHRAEQLDEIIREYLRKARLQN